MTTDLISEPMPTNDDGVVFPRSTERRPTRAQIASAGFELDVQPGDAQRAWLRPALPADVNAPAWPCEYRSPDCGHDCGCWIITHAGDERRVQPVWWIQ